MKKTALTLALTALTSLSWAQPQASMADMFMQKMDLNKDGKVDKIEFLKPYEAQFNMMDTNKDGAIDKDEVSALEQKMRARMEQMRQQRQQ